MATTFVIACPECEKQVKATDELVGKKIRCKGCAHVFVVKAPEKSASTAEKTPEKPKSKGPPPPPPKAEKKPEPPKKEEPKPETTKKPYDDDDDDDKKSYTLTKDESDLPRCPFCAKEMASETAVICLNCGYNTQTRLRPEIKKVVANTGGQVFLWLLPGILCVVTILGLVTWDLIFCSKIEGWIKESLYDEKDGWVAGLNPGFFKTMMTGFVITASFFLGKFAYKRLLINNRPVEKQLVKDED